VNQQEKTDLGRIFGKAIYASDLPYIVEDFDKFHPVYTLP
jgi:hypothetical protein